MASMLTRLGAVIRAMLGVPDYERYLRHMRRRHPGSMVLTQDEFIQQRLGERYSRPDSRCC